MKKLWPEACMEAQLLILSIYGDSLQIKARSVCF